MVKDIGLTQPCYGPAIHEIDRGTGEPRKTIEPAALLVGGDRQRSAADERHPSHRDPLGRWVERASVGTGTTTGIPMAGRLKNESQSTCEAHVHRVRGPDLCLDDADDGCRPYGMAAPDPSTVSRRGHPSRPKASASDRGVVPRETRPSTARRARIG